MSGFQKFLLWLVGIAGTLGLGESILRKAKKGKISGSYNGASGSIEFDNSSREELPTEDEEDPEDESEEEPPKTALDEKG